MTSHRSPSLLTRRAFLGGSALGASGLLLGGRSRFAWAQTPAPAAITRDAARPQLPSGLMAGDVGGDRAVVWSRTDRPARMIVEYATTDAFRDAAAGHRDPRRWRRPTTPRASISPDFPPGSGSSTA